jgi:hypothetical protein
MIITTVASSLLAFSAAGEVSSPKLNPQPEPPLPSNTLKTKKKLTNPAAKKGINPQPEPPKTKNPIKPKVREKVQLDPQPEPPSQMPKKPTTK